MACNPHLRDWRGKTVWLLGASSGIGAALARQLALAGARVAISGRRAEALEAVAAPLQAQGLTVLPVAADAADAAGLATARDRVEAALGPIDLGIYLAGDYVPLRAWELGAAAPVGAIGARVEPAAPADPALAQVERLARVNYLGAAAFAACLVPGLLGAARGATGRADAAGVGGGGQTVLAGAAGAPPVRGLVLVGSVAGYRGLPKALGYGAAKAALIHFAEGLYLDLVRPDHPGLGVWLVSPGFVATRLTAGNDFAMPALIGEDEAARAIVAGLASGAFDIHFPKRFTGWLKFARLLPYRLYFPFIRRVTGE